MNNPLLEPNSNISWMSKNVFNCGVVIDDDGLYKMLFRAAWTEDQSMSDCGLAISTEGTQWYSLNKPVLKCGFNEYCARGIEDPRIVKWIDGWKYIFATACSPAGGRVGIWKTKNFLEFEWVGIPFNQEDKNAAIFPEPIEGWVYLLHRKSPHIWISRTRDLTLRSGWQDSQILVYKNQFYHSPATGNLPVKIGLAGPPVKTPKGWLVIVHVVHGQRENMFNRAYSLGFMVLDLLDPMNTVKISIYPFPILSPTEKYEIIGAVPIVCFSNAIVDTGGEFFYIYWGGADTVICGGSLSKDNLPMCY